MGDGMGGGWSSGDAEPIPETPPRSNQMLGHLRGRFTRGSFVYDHALDVQHRIRIG